MATDASAARVSSAARVESVDNLPRSRLSRVQHTDATIVAPRLGRFHVVHVVERHAHHVANAECHCPRVGVRQPGVHEVDHDLRHAGPEHLFRDSCGWSRTWRPPGSAYPRSRASLNSRALSDPASMTNPRSAPDTSSEALSTSASTSWSTRPEPRARTPSRSAVTCRRSSRAAVLVVVRGARGDEGDVGAPTTAEPNQVARLDLALGRRGLFVDEGAVRDSRSRTSTREPSSTISACSRDTSLPPTRRSLSSRRPNTKRQALNGHLALPRQIAHNQPKIRHRATVYTKGLARFPSAQVDLNGRSPRTGFNPRVATATSVHPRPGQRPPGQVSGWKGAARVPRAQQAERAPPWVCRSGNTRWPCRQSLPGISSTASSNGSLEPGQPHDSILSGPVLPLQDVIPSKHTPVATLAVIGMGVATLLYQVVAAPTTEVGLTLTYGLVPASVEGIAWVSSLVLQTDAVAGIANVWALWIFGDNVEDRLGGFRFVLLVVAGGLGGAVRLWRSTPRRKPCCPPRPALSPRSSAPTRCCFRAPASWCGFQSGLALISLMLPALRDRGRLVPRAWTPPRRQRADSDARVGHADSAARRLHGWRSGWPPSGTTRADAGGLVGLAATTATARDRRARPRQVDNEGFELTYLGGALRPTREPVEPSGGRPLGSSGKVGNRTRGAAALSGPEPLQSPETEWQRASTAECRRHVRDRF